MNGLFPCYFTSVEVENHNLANWSVPGKPLIGVEENGSSIEQKLIVTMLHTDREAPKIVPLALCH